MSDFTVRQAKPRDFQRVSELEQQVWKEAGTPILGQAHFEAWHETYPEGFMVAEHQRQVVGMICTEAVTYNPNEKFPWATYDEVTDHSYIRQSHDPNGNCHFGLTYCSVHKGAGAPLLEALLELSNQKGRQLLGVSRLPGLAAYLNSDCAKQSDMPEYQLALHYVQTVVTMGKARVHSRLFQNYDPRNCPPVLEPDPTLRRYVRHGGFYLLELIPNFWDDPSSQGYTVLFAQNSLSCP